MQLTCNMHLTEEEHQVGRVRVPRRWRWVFSQRQVPNLELNIYALRPGVSEEILPQFLNYLLRAVKDSKSFLKVLSV